MGTRLLLTLPWCFSREQDPDEGYETVAVTMAASLATHGLRHSQKDEAPGVDRAGSG